jgi:effector-binding domain-containing protein
MKTTKQYIIPIGISILMIGCGGSNEKAIPEKKETEKTEKTVTQDVATTKAPIINLQDTIALKQTLLCIKDSATTKERLYTKLCDIYNTKLADCMKANKIKATGNPMVWHTKQKTAFFFEAGIPVDKAPNKPGKGMYMKSTSNDSVFVAHFFGPNELSAVAYDALNEKLTDLHKKKVGDSYEIYFGDYFTTTSTPKDFYKLRTDIVLPFK